MTELDRNKKIFEEYQRISIYFESLDENEKAVIDPLIRNAAFQRVALDDLQEIIAEQGPIESYQNGQYQSGLKQSAALQSYNSTMKVYAAVVKNLFGLLPKMKRPAVTPFVDEETAEERRERLKREQQTFAEWQKEHGFET